MNLILHFKIKGKRKIHTVLFQIILTSLLILQTMKMKKIEYNKMLVLTSLDCWETKTIHKIRIYMNMIKFITMIFQKRKHPLYQRVLLLKNKISNNSRHKLNSK